MRSILTSVFVSFRMITTSLSSHVFDGHINTHHQIYNTTFPPHALLDVSWEIYIFMSENNCRLKSLIVYLSEQRVGDDQIGNPLLRITQKLGIFTIGYLSKLRTLPMIDSKALSA